MGIKDWLHSLWIGSGKAICMLLFVCILGLFILIGRQFDIDLSRGASFGTLVALSAAGIAMGVYVGIGRLLFGRQPTGAPFPTWLKVILTGGLIIAVALAIWDGCEARSLERPVTYETPSERDAFRNAPSVADMERMEELRKRYRSTTRP